MTKTSNSLRALGLAVAFALSGCVSSPREETATHYWEAQDPKLTKQRYNFDHTNCQEQSETNADGSLDPKSTSFSAYRDCMIKQGYTLRTY